MRRLGLTAFLIALAGLAGGCWPFRSEGPESKVIYLKDGESRIARSDGTTVPLSK